MFLLLKIKNKRNFLKRYVTGKKYYQDIQLHDDDLV